MTEPRAESSSSSAISALIDTHRPVLAAYEQFYKTLHADPELSLQESTTSLRIKDHLVSLGYEVKTSIGGHGVVGILRNGSGKTVLIRADMDALPIAEATGLPYSSTKRMVDVADGVEKPVMHACGHDMHCSTLLAASELLKGAKAAWSGTLIMLFQPNEERAAGAKAMVDDGLYDPSRHDVPKPDIVLGAHIMPARAGTVQTAGGPFNSAADSFKITVFGRGGHGSRPHQAIDPVVMASSIVLKLQTIVSREMDPRDAVVVTVGSLQAGNAENIIAGEAVLKVNTRTFSEENRRRVQESIERIVRCECEAFRCPQPPKFESISHFPLLYNDEAVSETVAEAMIDHFGKDDESSKGVGFSTSPFPSMGSEDFSHLSNAVGAPCCFWNYGGIDQKVWDDAKKNGRIDEIAGTHSALFSPAIHPTMKTAIDAYAAGALAFLKR
ncbi:hypothetical protein AAFC00_005807 [Neodothiora populina]|uniref:Peptidase M20 dimerisation domain-containing protein n=1 Tax=Neodothiora populina TaxID=2781224 RepID=A0ABR3P623_9PEZI